MLLREDLTGLLLTLLLVIRAGLLLSDFRDENLGGLKLGLLPGGDLIGLLLMLL